MRRHACQNLPATDYPFGREPRSRQARASALLAVLVAGVLVVLAAAGPAPSAGASSGGHDTARVVWLCRPGLAHDPCEASLKTTVIEGATTRRVVNARPARRPKVDCFYLYPLVSGERTPNANLDVQPQETAIAELEASPFAQDCRIFAPMYRQFTLQGMASSHAEDVAYSSVVKAWDDYLAHHNDGRGFVLIGHSEGADQLVRLLADRINGDPKVRRRLVSAILTGASLFGNLVVSPKGVGPFSHVPACRSARETGCVIAYNAFTEMPRYGAYFGTPNPDQRGDVELCTNPAALEGGAGSLDSMYRVVLPTQLVAGSVGYDAPSRILDPPKVSTPWVELLHGYTGRCERGADGTDVLVVAARAWAPSLTATPGAADGLHADDPNLALGNLVRIVAQEARAYRRR